MVMRGDSSLDFDASRGFLRYEIRGKLQIQILCGADDNPRRRMNTAREEKRDPCLTHREIGSTNCFSSASRMVD